MPVQNFSTGSRCAYELQLVKVRLLGLLAMGIPNDFF